MELYKNYLDEIESRKNQSLKPKPIDDGSLLKEIIFHIKDNKSEYRKDCLNYFVYNTLPGTTSAAEEKAIFLKEIISNKISVDEISIDFAFELLSHMKGGPSVKVLLDFALGEDIVLATKALDILKTQVFLYDADTSRIEEAFKRAKKSKKTYVISIHTDGYQWLEGSAYWESPTLSIPTTKENERALKEHLEGKKKQRKGV